MGQDISADVAGDIAGAKTFGSSDNIRHGTYKLLIRRIHAQLVETDTGKNRMAFWEFTVLDSKPNPQIEGDHTDYPGTSGPLIDDGTKPNLPGSQCALKVNFDGPGGRSAGGNIKEAILALFNKRDGEISEAEINSTWKDLARVRPLKVGDATGVDENNQPIFAKVAKQANPACGMIINCTTRAKKKKKPNEKGAYITKLIWSCAAPMNTGENAPELIAKRRAEIEQSFEDDEDDFQATPQSVNMPAAPAAPAPAAPAFAAPTAPVAAPAAPAPAAPAAPAAPPAPAVFKPVAPWVQHPTAPGWFWSDPALGGNNAVKSEAQLRTGA